MMVTNNTGVDFDADVAFAVSDLGDTFTHAGTSGSIACVVSTINKGNEIDTIAGPTAEISFEIVVQTSLLTVRPVTGDVVVVPAGGTSYRALRVETDEADAALNIICGAYTA